MEEELLPDTDRYLGPIRRRPLVAMSVFVAVVALVVLGLAAAGSGSWTATARLRPDVDDAAVSVNAVLPSGLSDVGRGVGSQTIVNFFNFTDLKDDLRVSDAKMGVDLDPVAGTVEVTVSASSEARADSVLAELLSAYEAERRTEIDASVGAVSEGLRGRLAVVEDLLASLGDKLPSDLAERSGLAAERARLSAALEAVEDFATVTNLGLEIEFEQTEFTGTNSVSVPGIAVAIVLAAMAVVGGSVALGVIDTRVRTRRDLTRIARGVPVVGVVGADGTGVGPMALGLQERSKGSIVQLVATGRADSASLVERLRSAAGDTMSNLVAAPAIGESDEAAQRASTGARCVVVVVWGRTRDAEVTQAVSQLRIAGATIVELAIIDVPGRELGSAMR